MIWSKSSRSKDWNQALCVEVGKVTPGGPPAAIRDSKLGDDSPVIELGPHGWAQLRALIA